MCYTFNWGQYNIERNVKTIGLHTICIIKTTLRSNGLILAAYEEQPLTDRKYPLLGEKQALLNIKKKEDRRMYIKLHMTYINFM